MATDAKLPRSGEGLKIINAGLFRMATKSMAEAYVILGFKTHHGLLESVSQSPWPQLEAAAEATWPTVPGGPSPPRPPFGRADWDAIWGSYDAVTDLASPFVPELIKAYPEAKVVIVQRDFDTWFPSFRTELMDQVMKQPLSAISAFVAWNIMGSRAVHAMRKVLLGFLGGKTKAEAEANARVTYDAYFREIRSLVPPERRLEYKVGSGWEPLCEFLGVEVPAVAFPRSNELAAHAEVANSRRTKYFVDAAKRLTPWAIGLTAVGVAWVYYRR